MDGLSHRLDLKIEHLNNMLAKYDKLNRATKGAYNWRSQAIQAQIDALEELRNYKEDSWELCYKEDKTESGL